MGACKVGAHSHSLCSCRFERAEDACFITPLFFRFPLLFSTNSKKGMRENSPSRDRASACVGLEEVAAHLWQQLQQQSEVKKKRQIRNLVCEGSGAHSRER